MASLPPVSETLLQQLRWRYATKRFDRNRKVPADQLRIIEESARLAPSSYGLQPWKIVVVTDEAIRKELTPVSFNQPQIEECSHLFVFSYKARMDEAHVDLYLDQIARTRGVGRDTLAAFEKTMKNDVVFGPRNPETGAWAARQAYIALGTVITAAALLGVDACPMEGFQPAEYDRILKLDAIGYRSIALVALGYRSPEDRYQFEKKVRLDREVLFIRK